MNVLNLRLWFLLLSLGLWGCGSPIVGLECKAGLTRCGNACFDLDSDEDHCGICDRTCGDVAMCVEGSCVAIGPGSDGGADGSMPMTDAGSDGGMGPITPPLCKGPGSPDDCVCGLGELKCGTTCVQAGTDPNNCGECDKKCDSGDFCIAGACSATCDAPLIACGALCVDQDNDVDNCGGCGVSCSSGLCADGECQGASAGHVIVIGHDMSASRTALNRVVGNAIFLPSAEMLRVLVYDKDASAASKAGVMAAIEAQARLTGRDYKRTNGSALTVPFLLKSSADVFVIASQQSATDEILRKNGASWSAALQEFTLRGGTVVLFDGGGTHAGTFQILRTAGLFDANGRTPLSRRSLSLVAPADAVATGVPREYRSEGTTVGFDSSEATVVIEDPMTSSPVVIHIAR